MNSADAAKVAVDAGHPGVFLTYFANTWQSPYGSGWQVRRPGYQTDPSRIHNGGVRQFPGVKNGPALDQAKAWATARYGVAEWVKVPGFQGDYFPAAAVPVIVAARKVQLAEAERP